MKIALGTAQFGLDYGIANKQGQVSRDEGHAIISTAKAAGITLLDTAIAYGDSEKRLGEIGLSGWQVVSKLPGLPGDCGDICTWVVDTVAQSLDRLKVEKLYGLLLHKPQELLGDQGPGLYQGLQTTKSKGLVEKIGVSIYDPIEFDELKKCYHFDILQAPFNVLDRRLTSTAWFSRLSANGIELHARSIFLQGLLLMPANLRREKFHRWSALWSTWDAWLERSRFSPLQACLGHVLAFTEIDKVVVGVDSCSQLEDILRALNGAYLKAPENLRCHDSNLLNPSQWENI